MRSTPPSTSGRRLGTSSCFPSATAIFRPSPRLGGTPSRRCRACASPASSGCGIRCPSISTSKMLYRKAASSSSAASAGSTIGATASSRWRRRAAAPVPSSSHCPAMTGPTRASAGYPPCRRSMPPCSTHTSARAAPATSVTRFGWRRRWCAERPSKHPHPCRSGRRSSCPPTEVRSTFRNGPRRHRVRSAGRWSSSIDPACSPTTSRRCAHSCCNSRRRD